MIQNELDLIEKEGEDQFPNIEKIDQPSANMRHSTLISPRSSVGTNADNRATEVINDPTMVSLIGNSAYAD